MSKYKVVWHREFHVDYSHFPAIDWMAKENEGKEIAPNPMYKMTDRQVASYELWRRKQQQAYNLSVYQSHFADFAKYPHSLPTDFFDFHVNILQRRHQAFIENQSENPLILLSPGFLLNDLFHIEPYLKIATEKNILVIVNPALANIPRPSIRPILDGMWIIPPQIQQEFAKPLPVQVETTYGVNDIWYWLQIAEEHVVLQDPLLHNVYPILSEYDDTMEKCELGNSEKPLSKHKYPAWTTDDFRNWINQQKFRFAKTMRWCPHEYIFMWDRTLEDQMDYLMAIDYVHRNAVVDEFQGKYKLAAYVDEHKYWYVGVIDLLNRTSMELQRRIFAEDGKDERGRKKKENGLFDK